MNRKILVTAVLSAALIVPLSPLFAIENAAWLARIEGVYMGQNNPTPFGRIGFAMEMTKQPDGSVHGRVQSDRDTYFDFAFRLNDRGGITFDETGALGQGFVQSHELELVESEGDTLTFATEEKPALLVAEVTADDSRLRVKVLLRGKPHVDLDMTRVRDEQVAAKFRADQARAKELPGGSALQQFFAAEAAKAVDGTLPKHEQAAQHIAEYKHLMEQMETADASARPSMAFLMKGHVDKAIELDPSFDEARFALAMWYLQSPELATKSWEKVNEILVALERMNSPLVEALRNKLAGRTGGRL
jgi:hypothetical protein